MKLPISPGQYLFYTGLIYLAVGMYSIFVDRFVEPEVLQVGWLVVLLIPVLLPIPKIVRSTPLWKVK